MQKAPNKTKTKKPASVFDKPETFAGSFEQANVPAAAQAGSRKKTDPPFAGKKGRREIK